MKTYTINNLPVPQLLIKLMKEGKWKNPKKEIIKEVIPFFKYDIDFLRTIEEMRSESQGICEDVDFFFEKRSSKDDKAKKLPYRDLDLSFLIAVSASLGDDIAIALDFRTSMENPRVIANNWWRNKEVGCQWEEVSPDFESFVKALKLI